MINAKFWEDFVCRTRANWPPEKHYKISVRRLPEQSSNLEASNNDDLLDPGTPGPVAPLFDYGK
jgi:hypothetical protein